MEAVIKEIHVFCTVDNEEPFTEWLRNLKDQRGRQKIQARLARVRLGNPGFWNSVGEGLFELKIDFGPGYRIYYGQDGDKIIILLCGGDKGSQNADIKKAKKYWTDYKKAKSDANERL